MPRAGFEPAIPATKRPKTYALDCASAALSIGNSITCCIDGLSMILSVNSVNKLMFVMVKCGVLFEVRTEFLNII
jgi:hypothetical protein